MDKITVKQIRAIWGCAGRLKISGEDLRDWVYARTGKKSIRELTPPEASKLIDELIRKSEFASGNRMTPAQARWISFLEKKIGWDPTRLLGLARKMYRVENLEELNRKEASGLIEALKAMGTRRSKENVA